MFYSKMVGPMTSWGTVYTRNPDCITQRVSVVFLQRSLSLGCLRVSETRISSKLNHGKTLGSMTPRRLCHDDDVRRFLPFASSGRGYVGTLPGVGIGMTSGGTLTLLPPGVRGSEERVRQEDSPRGGKGPCSGAGRGKTLK